MSESEDRLDRALSDRLAGRADDGNTLASYRGTLAALEDLRRAAPRDPAAAAHGRQAFLEQAQSLRQTVSRKTRERRNGWNFLPRKERSPMTALVSLALALALAFGGAGATAYAAQDSLPSQPLYEVKLLSEQVRLALTIDLQRDLDLLAGFAAERIREMTALAAAGEVIPDRVQSRLQEQVELALHYAAQLGDSEMAGALARIRTMAENQVQAIAQARRNAPPQADEALRLAEQLMTRARNSAQDGLADPLGFRLRQGTSRPEEAPAQPDAAPGGGYGPGGGVCDDCTPESPGPGAGGAGQGGYGPGRRP